MMLDAWAARHGVSAAALHELRMLMGVAALQVEPAVDDGAALGSESRQQALVRLDAARCQVWLTRNNVGCLNDNRGVPVRYGLWNESSKQNEAVKSSDLIGIRPVVITHEHVGRTIGQFVARECKHEGWRYSPRDKRSTAQLAFINFINSKGGDAAFATGPGTFNNQR